MDVELFENAAPVRIGCLVADTKPGGSFLGGLALGDEYQNLALALRKGEHHPDGLLVGGENALLPLADIYCGAHIAGEIPVLVKARDSSVLYPAEFSVRAQKAELHAERLTRAESFEIRLETQVAVIRVDAFRPAVLALLFQVAPPKFQPGAIEVGAESIRPRYPDHHWSSVGQRQEPLFANLLRLLVALQLGLEFGQLPAQRLHFIDLVIQHLGLGSSNDTAVEHSRIPYSTRKAKNDYKWS
jgi:hypothetical protein